jgi:hypothetical protein
MANVLGLALKITGDASGVSKSLTQAERALDNLGKQAEKVTNAFGPLAEKSAAAALAQEQFADKFSALADQLDSRVITPQEYAAAFEQLAAEVDSASKAFEEGARVAERYRTEDEKRAIELQKIQDLLESGAISEDVAARARADASGASASAAEAERELARAKDEAAKIVEASLSAEERALASYETAVARAEELEARGLLTTEQLNTERERQAAILDKATEAAAKAAGATGDLADKSGEAGLQLNEVSGFLGLLPGPIGGVAAKISSLASSAEGLGKILDNPMQAISGFASSLTFLASPAGIATAAIAGLGAAAAGLKSLEGELESLTNTATKLGVSFQFVETLKQSSEMAGVSFGTVNTAMTRLLRTLAGADEESKKAAKSLEAVGLSFDDIKGKDSEEQIRLIAERLNGIEDPAKRAAAATAVFGRAGAELLPAFQNLAAGEKTLERFNARIADIDRDRILALGDSFDAVGAATKGFGNEVLTPFIGTVQSLSDGFASTIAVVGRNVGSILDILSPIASGVGGAINVFLQFGSVLSNLIGFALEPFATAGRLVSSVFDAQSRFLTELFGRINDVINAFREFFKFTAAAEGLNETFTYLWQTFERVSAIATATFFKLGDVIGKTIAYTIEIVQAFVSKVLEFTGLSEVVSSLVNSFVAGFTGIWEGIKYVVGQVGGFIESVLKFAENWLGIVPEIEKPVEATVEVNGGGAIEELLKESKDFQKTLDDITSSVSKAIDESSKFGQAGFDAAVTYQESINKLKDQLDAGLFNEETFKREAARAGEAFKGELKRIEEDAKLDIKISDDTQKTLDGLQQKINKVADDSTKFGQAGFDAAAGFQEKLRDLGNQFEDGRINAAALANEVEKATGEYDKQIEGFKKIEELQQSIVKADQDRVNALLAQNNTTTEMEKNQAAVQREQLRLEEEIRKQREAGNVIAADAAASRLAQVDQESTKLADLKQAADQGFGDGFGKAFEATSKSIEDIIDKTKSFGVAGQIAASDLRAGIEAAQAKARDGFLGKEAYDKEVARQQEIFEQRAAGAQRVEEFLRGQLDERQRAELDFAAQVEERKKQAALNIQALQDRINAEEQAVQEARDAGNLKAAKDGTARLKQLRQAEKIEKNIAAGRISSQQQAAGGNQQFGAAIAQQQRAAQSQQRMLASANDAIAATARAGAELARRAELARPVQGPVATADIRTAEGAKLVLGLGAQAQDPQLIEARLQTKQLQGIRTAITNAVAGYLNTPAEIF